jgi:hypothetical protein
MKKTAIFVEGSTEAIFIEWLIKMMVPSRNKVVIDHQAMNGKKGKRIFSPIRVINEDDIPTHYIQIINSGNDEMVKSDIIEQASSLQGAGFSSIIGIRDLYPESIESLSKIEEFLEYGMPSGIPARIFLAVMEIEAWFIAEY